MGFWSALGSSLGSAASSISLHDLTGGWSDMSSRKYAAKYEFELAQRAAESEYQMQLQMLRDAPSAQKAGLIAAGYNPMLAISNGVSQPSAPHQTGGHVGSSGSNSKLDLSFLGKLAQEQAKESIVKTKKEGDAIELESESNSALKAAETQKVLKEAESITPSVVRENRKYGNTALTKGALDFVRLFKGGLGFDSDTVDDKPFKTSASPDDSSSAPSFNSAHAVKKIIDALPSPSKPSHRMEREKGSLFPAKPKKNTRRHN